MQCWTQPWNTEYSSERRSLQSTAKTELLQAAYNGGNTVYVRTTHVFNKISTQLSNLVNCVAEVCMQVGFK